ncbi:adenylate/guanylate cyclase domain-containing protein [Sulfurimonas paralvinellae]|uniref:Adenylate/guanylate cyclase domain-containing protein n=1 Tax=Sulfurimonas paralvinellae TaxID=317658 RepID=A0A7M1B782_9BACT|nr:adenylate/guanylate cyclase domain-containing protein [Sulfurimonas paralvinellae]QOP45563.1 adenylate/guanylate cyclase domain-containing protein [Sulfurimonas paralvinellae]
MIRKTIKELLYRGGLKLKLISFVFVSIFLAISVQNYFIIPFIKENIEKKAFEVSSTTIERISDFSSFALLERTYENRLSLNDAIERLKESHIDGLLGISIYERQKNGQKNYFQYISGFGEKVKDLPLEKGLLKYLQNCKTEHVTYDTYTIKTPTQSIETYRFIRPILYKYKGENILLGFTLLYYDKKAISKIIDQVLNYIYTIAFIILLLSTLYVYFIGTRVTKPILEITKASSEITKGNLDIHLDIHTNDEIQNLANHFNTMVNWLKEKDKLQKFVSNSTVDMIKKSSHEPAALGGEYRNMTFLFCDIRDFTSLNEKKTPQEVIEIVNFYFSLQAKIIKKNKGDIDKFIGDETMASFSGEDASQRALQSAIEIQQTIQKENILRKNENKTTCQVGIGISKGQVIVGNVGYDDHMDYTAIGLAVNMTSRLCSYAKGGEIIIDKKTFAHSGYKCNYTLTEPLSLKGITNHVTAYSIESKVS